MLQFFRDRLTTAQLRARYQRIVHERLIQLTEAAGPQPVSDEPGNWQLVGNAKAGSSPHARMATRDKVRQLVRESPHACNILRLLEAYVTGPGLQLTHQAEQEHDSAARNLVSQADRLWDSFLKINRRHYSFREQARRTWRDGECFLRKFSGDQWPPAIRFIDPEAIAPTPEEPGSQGILTDPLDVESPLEYLRVRPEDGELLERIPATEMLHTRIGVDTNEKRGVSLFTSIVDSLNCFEKWMETELLARKLQSSIVLWRKVQGSPHRAAGLADQAADSTGLTTDGRRERILPGTILTTNHGTEIQFLQPNTNFGDAVALGRMVLLAVAAGAGLPEFMLTSDASNANFASTMIAEGPAVKFFQSQQQFFADEFSRLWQWIMEEAVAQGDLPQDFFERVTIRWSFPQLVNRDRPRERLADVRLIDSGVLSRAEVARRDGVDPAVMRAERETEGRSDSE